MPTPAQNRVYKAYGIRKSDLRWRMRKASDEVRAVAYDAGDRVLTGEDVARAQVALVQLASDSVIWQAYREAEKPEVA